MACSDLVVIRYLSCVSRRSILITFPHGLVLWMSYNNWPGAIRIMGPAWIPTHYCGKVSGWTGLLSAFIVGDGLPSPPSFYLYFCLFFYLYFSRFYPTYILFYSPIFFRCVVVTCRWCVCYCHVALVNCFCVVLFCGM